MAYVNNGTERSLKVKVYKSVGGNYAQGYPKTYDGQLAFPGYSTLTDTEVRQLSDVDFNARLAAFESYVESVESGVDFDTDIVGYGATRESAACLEVTTTTLAPVYAFSIRYGYLPVDACNGTAAIVYSNKSNPGVGDFLYKDPALSIPWNTTAGSSVLFMSPKVHGDQVVGVAIVDTVEYDPGEIMLLTGFSCSGVITPTTSTTTTTSAGVLYYRMYRCDGSTCWLSRDVKDAYEFVHGPISTGNRFYGAVEGDPNYLYTYTGLTQMFYSLPTCFLTGITATSDVCT